MKRLTIILLVIFNLSCAGQNTKIKVLKEFISGVIKFDAKNLNQQQPLISIRELAKNQAGEIIKIDAKNIKAALDEAKSFKHCFILIENHTIIKITDHEKTSPSGCWRAAMPMCKGYIQRSGVLQEKKDYLKNLIGRPDSKLRTMYLFN